MNLPLHKMIDIPPIWLLSFAAMLWGLDRTFAMPTGSGFVTAFGTGMVVAGCVLILWAAWTFQQHKTTIIPHLTASSLITTGAFAYSRNPIYLADAIILTGLCLRWDMVPGVVLVPIFVWIITQRFIKSEEDRLRNSFDQVFDSYAEKTRRWV